MTLSTVSTTQAQPELKPSSVPTGAEDNMTAYTLHASAVAPPAWHDATGGATPGLGNAVQIAGGLVVVIGLIFGLGMLLKRLGHGRSPRAQQRVLNMIDTQVVGQKERVVVIEIEATWLVVGITPQGITPLHTLPRPATAESSPEATSSRNSGMPFSQALRQAVRQTLGRKPPVDADRPSRSKDDRNDHV